MKRVIVGSVLALACMSVRADTTYALSPDGSTVVRLEPGTSASSSSFDTALLPAGYTATAGSLGSLLVGSYTAGFMNGAPCPGCGGAFFTALYNTGLQASSNLNWIQVFTANAPAPGGTYLDNFGNPSTPFYSGTQQNRNPNLPGNELNFLDFPARGPSYLNSINPVTFDATLYPVLVGGTGKSLQIENGLTYGFSMTNAMVGKTSAVFTNPVPESNPVLSGVGTNTFSWGSGDPSSLTFTGKDFHTSPNTPFDLGTLTFHNGTIPTGSGADGVNFDLSISFDNVPEKNFDLNTEFGLVNTPNTNNPYASADYVTIGNYGYTFDVFEGATARVDIYAKLTTNLSGYPAGTGNVDSVMSTNPFEPSPEYILTIVGLGTPSSGGFTTSSVPEPAMLPAVLAALVAIALAIFRRRLLRPSRAPQDSANIGRR